jgi:hypothetical protein
LGFINAIGRPFRKRRTPSAVNLPANAHISLKKNDGEGGAATSTVLVETKPIGPSEAEHTEEDVQEQGVTLQVEVPVFDEAALQRSIDDAQLKSLFERHKEERERFVRLQNELVDSLKAAHLLAVAERKKTNELAEKEKEEQVRTTSLSISRELELFIINLADNDVERGAYFANGGTTALCRNRPIEGIRKGKAEFTNPH